MNRKIIFVIALLHLLLTVLYAAHFGEWGPPNSTTSITYTIGEYTGSNNLYSFFAPYIGSQVNVIYTVVDSNKNQKLFAFTGHNRETLNRINTVYNFLSLAESKKVLCRSFAEQVFTKNPNSAIVRVMVIERQIPTMKEYQKGIKPKWRTLFYKDYRRL